MTTNQQLDLDAIEARKNAATPGPWGSHRDLSAVYTVQARPRTTQYGMESDGDIATLAAGRSDSESYANARFISHAPEDIAALVAEVRRLRAAMEQIRHLHKDSPMGPCPVCIDADAIAEGRDGLMPYPCPTGRLAGAQDCEPSHVRAARYAAAGDEMAASLCRDGLGDDEIVEIQARAANRCGAAHHRYPETVCTEPAGHYQPDRDPHAGPLVIDGREAGAAVWDEHAAPAARSAAV